MWHLDTFGQLNIKLHIERPIVQYALNKFDLFALLNILFVLTVVPLKSNKHLIKYRYPEVLNSKFIILISLWVERLFHPWFLVGLLPETKRKAQGKGILREVLFVYYKHNTICVRGINGVWVGMLCRDYLSSSANVRYEQ